LATYQAAAGVVLFVIAMTEKVYAPSRVGYVVFEASPTRSVPGRPLATFESRLDAIEYSLDLVATRPRHVAIFYNGHEITDKFVPGPEKFHHTYVAPAGSIRAGRVFEERYAVKTQ
jgi:hypothetical protein